MEESLYDKASQAIEKLFSDKSVTKEETEENLQALIDEIQTMIESLDV